MSLGTRILMIRNQNGLSQQELSKRTGLAASYLSRVENRRLEPGPRTLRRIAAALEVPVSELFQEPPLKLGSLQCVVTGSGKCIGDLLRSARGKLAGSSHETYTPRQLQLLRMANYLIETADARLLDSLEVLFGALLAAERNKSSPRQPLPALE
jgi:transcriptional regulator with XRE-family HTH domain